MSSAVRTLDMPAPPAEIWEVLSDFGAISSWASNVDHSCLLSERLDGIGAVRRIQTGRATLTERVVAWDPPSTLSYRLDGLPPVVRSVYNTWHVYPLEKGSRVSLTSRITTGPRPPQQLVGAVVGRKLGEASDQMLSGLAARVAIEGARS